MRFSMRERLYSWQGLRVVALVAAGMMTCSSMALCQTAQDVLDHLRQRYEEANDAQVKFSQRVKLSVAKVEQHASGLVEFKKEHKYRIELEDQTIVTDGQTVWSYSRPAQQVLIDKYTLDERTISPERILTGAPQDFAATLLGKESAGNRDLFVLKLVPKGQQTTVKSMKLWVDDDEWLIRKVELLDWNGTETTYTVSEIRLNLGLPDSRFTFEIPQGANVVDLR